MYPNKLNDIINKANDLNFVMNCDTQTGQLLRVLANSKLSGCFLELGTGVGASTTWILDGMDKSSRLISIEIDETLQSVAKSIINDERVDFINIDGVVYIEENTHKKFDLIFADTWPGKFKLLNETLSMVNTGGFYIIDDLNEVDTWDEEHKESVKQLISTIKNLEDFEIVELNWSTGLIIATKK